MPEYQLAGQVLVAVEVVPVRNAEEQTAAVVVGTTESLAEVEDSAAAVADVAAVAAGMWTLGVGAEAAASQEIHFVQRALPSSVGFAAVDLIVAEPEGVLQVPAVEVAV